MLFGIRSQIAILVIMLVSSTGLTLGLACVYTHKCTYTRTGKSDSKSEMIIYYILQRERGCHIQYVGVNKQMRVSSLRISEANGRGFS